MSSQALRLAVLRSSRLDGLRPAWTLFPASSAAFFAWIVIWKTEVNEKSNSFG